MSLPKSFWLARRSKQLSEGTSPESVITFESCLDALYSYIQMKMIENEKAVSSMSIKEQHEYTKELIDEFVSQKNPMVDGFVDLKNGVIESNRLISMLRSELLEWGILTDAMNDPEISEIECNDYKSIYVERSGETSLLTDKYTGKPVYFDSADDAIKIANKLLRFSEVSLSRMQALQGGMTMEGYRVAAVDPSVAAPDKAEGGLEDKSPMFVIRKYGSEPPKLEKLIEWHSITMQQANFLKALAKTGIPIVICGATGSGKTVLLQSILNNRVLNRRLAVVEDQSELNAHVRNSDGVDQSNTFQFEAKPTPPSGEASLTYPTFLNITMQLLRMTPRTIVLGEMRTDEIVSQAMTAAYTGHCLYSTIHAESVEDCVTRMTKCVQAMSNGTPWDVNMQTVCAAIPFILSQQRLDDGSRRLLEFAEIEGTEMRDGKLVPKVNMIFKFIADDSRKTSDEDIKIYGDFYQVGRVSEKMEEKLRLKALTRSELQILLSGPDMSKGEAPILCTFGDEKEG